MQKSKTTEKESKPREDSSSLPVSSEEFDNRSIKKRYIDLWRARMKNDDFKDSLVPPASGGMLFFLSSLAFAPSILSSSILLLIGSILGLMYSGYKYETDNFTGFHVALLSYVPLASTLLIATAFASPSLLPLAIPLVLFYAVAVGSSGVTYTMLGRQASQKQ